MSIRVAEIQRFCMHDGPGVRTTVFLKGCPLRCAWCHNPETQSDAPQILFYPNKCIGCRACAEACRAGAHTSGGFERDKCILCGGCVNACPSGALARCGRDMTLEQILEMVEKDRAFYGNNGGVTLSGGEPLAQKEAIALLKKCRDNKINTVVDTCGFFDEATLRAALPFVDLFLWDIKDTDDARHRQFTGVSNKKILKNLSLANETGARIRLRCLLINGVNTDERHYSHLADIARGIKRLDGIDIIPYHAYAGTKATFLGLPDNGKTEWIPSKEQIAHAKEKVLL